MRYFGFAFSLSMLPEGDALLEKRDITRTEAAALLSEEYASCVNPSHQATIDALESRFGISVAVPEAPPRVALRLMDEILVLQVTGLPRLTDRHEYTEEEVASATFKFMLVQVRQWCLARARAGSAGGVESP